MFEPTSRYAEIATATLTVSDPDGRERVIVYKRRRFVPDTKGQTILAEHSVRQGERLDNIAARYVGDPAQFWRICDANLVLKPAALEVPGSVIRLALPGI